MHETANVYLLRWLSCWKRFSLLVVFLSPLLWRSGALTIV